VGWSPDSFEPTAVDCVVVMFIGIAGSPIGRYCRNAGIGTCQREALYNVSLSTM